jgi:hypothetical protein
MLCLGRRQLFLHAAHPATEVITALSIGWAFFGPFLAHRRLEVMALRLSRSAASFIKATFRVFPF